MAEYTIDKIEYDSNVYKLQDNISGYTTNTGTVTSVGISNNTNGGLSVSGSPVTSSGTITIGHSNVLTSAQTTQAVYPIKIDKNGHISAYGTAVDIPSISLNGSSTTSASFYAPTSAGTNGYYLKSNGSGAPTWTAFPTIPTINQSTMLWDDSAGGEYGGIYAITTTGLDVELLTSETLFSEGGTVLQSSNLKTINDTSIIGSGNISVSTVAAQIIRW